MSVGMIIHRTQGLSVPTALFGMAPGGIADMTLAAMDFGADVSAVALLQTIRLIFLLIALPPVIRFYGKKNQQSVEPKKAQTKKQSPKSIKWENLLIYY